MEPQRSYKFTMFIKRKPGMTEDDFHNYWSHEHVPIVNGWLTNHGVIRYSQVSHRSTSHHIPVELC